MRRAPCSIETGHFYAADFAKGTASLARQFSIVKLYATAAMVPGASTTFLFDDYHNRPGGEVKPPQIVDQIREAAGAAGLSIDYLAREAACTRLAIPVLDILRTTGHVRNHPEDAPTGAWLLDRPPGQESSSVAMSGLPAARAGRLALEMSVELYDTPAPGRTSWACPYLAAIWQGLRLGVLRDPAFDEPYQLSAGDAVPAWETWEDTPPLIQLNPDAAPFVAAQTFSILPTDFLPVEGAVNRILDYLGPAMDAGPLSGLAGRAFIDV